MFNFKTKEKSVNERVSELKQESVGIIQGFTDMIEKIKSVNEKIDADKEQAVEQKQALENTIAELEKTKMQNQSIQSKIESIIK